MNTSFYIAKRYLFSKKSTNAIHIISGITMLGVFIGSAALIIILSVFNGFEEMILKMYNSISPQITVLSTTGKFFSPQDSTIQKLTTDKRIAYFVETLQENAVLKYRDRQSVALVKGVSPSFLANKQLDSVIVDGKFMLQNAAISTAVLGIEVQSLLNINVNDPLNTISIYSPKKSSNFNSINPYDDFVISNISAAGVFNVDQYYNNQVIVPLKFARGLFLDSTHVSSLEIYLKKTLYEDDFQKEWQARLGEKFQVNNRFHQNKLLYQILLSEKWAIYIILTFILIIAIFNIIGSLTMLVMDKVKDIAILSSLGARKNLIRKIFLLEGSMISLIGCIAGLIIGGMFCYGQKKYGWIQMANSTLTEAFPIHMRIKDFILVFFTVSIISWISASIASVLSVKRLVHLKEDL